MKSQQKEPTPESIITEEDVMKTQPEHVLEVAEDDSQRLQRGWKTGGGLNATISCELDSSPRGDAGSRIRSWRSVKACRVQAGR